MVKCTGKSVLKGIAIGKIYVYRKKEFTLVRTQIANVDDEIKRFELAVEAAEKQLETLYQEALETVGEKEAKIFEVHGMMLEDEGYLEDIKAMIRDKCNAEYAVKEVGDNYSQMFAAMDNEYMRARSVDILDISNKVINILAGVGDDSIKSDEPVILLADDLTPSETISMDKDKVLAFVTVHGSANSHTAILARSLNLPSLVNTDVALLDEYQGKMAIVDGFSDEFVINPPEDVLEDLTQKRDKWVEEAEI